jgi:hypothetical protein
MTGINNPFCGQADLEPDDRPDPVVNANNVGPSYSYIACYTGDIVEHELGHNIGAVQSSAPHSSGYGHCYQENDDMCDNDGGSYFVNGGVLTYPCPNAPYYWFDCKGDDYYNKFPAAGSYLATHWNTARSGFLTP